MFHAELRRWTGTRPGRDDGVPRSAGGPRPAGGSVLKLRDFGIHESTVERPFGQDPLVAVLATRPVEAVTLQSTMESRP